MAVEVNALVLVPGVVVIAVRSERIVVEVEARRIEVIPVFRGHSVPGVWLLDERLARLSTVVSSSGGGQQLERGLGDPAAVDLDVQPAWPRHEFAAGG